MSSLRTPEITCSQATKPLAVADEHGIRQSLSAFPATFEGWFNSRHSLYFTQLGGAVASEWFIEASLAVRNSLFECGSDAASSCGWSPCYSRTVCRPSQACAVSVVSRLSHTQRPALRRRGLCCGRLCGLERWVLAFPVLLRVRSRGPGGPPLCYTRDVCTVVTFDVRTPPRFCGHLQHSRCKRSSSTRQ